MIAIQRVLAPVDFSEESMLAAKFAASLAREYRAKLYVLRVRTPVSGFATGEVIDFEAIERRQAEEEKAELSKVVPREVKEIISVEEISVVGSPVHHLIVETAKELDVEIIVIATHGRTGLAHVLLGSVAEHVIRHAPCPVLVIRNPKGKYASDWEE